ncbi:MAG TPA: hypothetical protein VGF39_15745 [Stellaceae bacterium]|jgi:hypothetical protein
MSIRTLLGITDAMNKGLVGPPTTVVTLVNGLNSNIPAPATGRIRIAGPTGAFTIGGILGGTDGRIIQIYSPLAFVMTIANEDGSTSPAQWRIRTLTGANAAMRAGPSFVVLSFDGAEAGPGRWILMSTNGGAL